MERWNFVPAKTHVLPLSPLGLMEMTRQRAKESLIDSIYMTCPHCHGHGHIKTPMSMSVEVQRKLHLVMRKHQDTVHELRAGGSGSRPDPLRNDQAWVRRGR